MSDIRDRSITIVGAGPVGLTVAALMARSEAHPALQIQILEPRPIPSWEPKDTDLRVYALSRASQRVLEHVNVWGEIARARVSPYRAMRVWEGDDPFGLGSLYFDCAELGESDLGHIVEDRLIRDRLFNSLADCPNVELRVGAEVAAVRNGARAVEIETRSGETFSSTVLVAADGGASTVRELMDLPVTTAAYGQEAIVAHVESSESHRETAWQRFLPDGPLAFLPLVDGRSSVVWSLSTSAAQRLSSASTAEFLAELSAASGGALGDLTASSERASFPLKVLHARHYCTQRVALVGDAAHTIHPLAGQGMNLGLLDAAALADTLTAALCRQEDPGDLRVLRRYERQRKGGNLKTLLAMDALHRLFRLPGPLFAPLRAAGLSAVDASGFAKRRLMREALGISGELPGAARRFVA